jgi:hypothetical protein
LRRGNGKPRLAVVVFMHKTRFLLLTAVIGVIVVLLMLASCGRRTVPPDQEPLPLATFTPTPVLPTPTPVPPQPVAGAGGDRFQLVISEQQLTEQARRAIAAGSSSPVQDITIDAQTGRLWITARALLGFFPVDVGMAVTVTPQNGQVQLAIQDITINGAHAGGVVSNQIDRLVRPYLDRLAIVGQDVYVESVIITDNQLEITGRQQ